VGEPHFDVEEAFDEDYLYFYEEVLDPERTEAGVDLIWRLLELEPGMEVLDLASGHGRIANRLAERGCRVTGLDITPFFLDLARRDAAERGVEVEHVEGDMRSLPWSDRFDRIVCWFTSFGYFDDPGNRRVLAEACRALKPGGRLLIENNNRDFVLSHFDPERIAERDGDFMLDRSEFDEASGRIETERIVIRDGRVRRFRFFVRTFTFTELRDWLLQAGFGSVEAFGLEGEPFSLESRRMITVARR
jgi:SAM-dependent methyltransferase